MNMKPLTVRKKISNDESLYSFLLRCAEANGMSFFELFNLLKKTNIGFMLETFIGLISVQVMLLMSII